MASIALQTTMVHSIWWHDWTIQQLGFVSEEGQKYFLSPYLGSSAASWTAHPVSSPKLNLAKHLQLPPRIKKVIIEWLLIAAANLYFAVDNLETTLRLAHPSVPWHKWILSATLIPFLYNNWYIATLRLQVLCHLKTSWWKLWTHVMHCDQRFLLKSVSC